jgi:hypothetical protein
LTVTEPIENEKLQKRAGQAAGGMIIFFDRI